MEKEKIEMRPFYDKNGIKRYKLFINGNPAVNNESTELVKEP
jgi:hypothetical protein